MNCEICLSELAPGETVCQNCGAPVLREAPGFSNAVEIQKRLRSLVIENSGNGPFNTRKLVALMKDYLVDFKAECRLLVYTVNAGVFNTLAREKDHNIAVLRARGFLIKECFVSEEAAEFVLICLTYLLKWEYKPPVSAQKPEPVRNAPVQDAPKPEKEEPAAENAEPVSVDSRVFKQMDAVKYRLSRNIEIQKKFTKIDGFAFDKFSSIRTVKLPDSLIAIGQYAFSGCKHLRIIEIPNSVRLIEQGAFSQCFELSGIYIPEGVLEIADNTFLCCESLSSVVLPGTVSSIGAQAFSGCERLRRLVVPDSVKYIDESAFLCCPNITIRCYENSYAHKFCLARNINFEFIPVGIN